MTAFLEFRWADGETFYPAWRDEYGIVHMVGLHTNTSIRTECGVLIVRGRVREQLERYEASREFPTCLSCVAEWEPY